MDRTTNLIFAAIAAGLWLNAGALVFGSTPASAKEYDYQMGMIYSSVEAIANGTCLNRKICGI